MIKIILVLIVVIIALGGIIFLLLKKNDSKLKDEINASLDKMNNELKETKSSVKSIYDNLNAIGKIIDNVNNKLGEADDFAVNTLKSAGFKEKN